MERVLSCQICNLGGESASMADGERRQVLFCNAAVPGGGSSGGVQSD